MTVEELLQPRFEVIALYPSASYEIGEIIEVSGDFDGVDYTEDIVKQFSDFPHLFRKLQWFEKRTVDQMPKYFRYTEPNGKICCFALNPYEPQHLMFPEWAIRFNYQPCTEEEYLKSKNQ